VLAGEDQFGFSNVVSLLTAREKGRPAADRGRRRQFYRRPGKDVNAVLVGKGSTLQSAKDLAGKKVAINSLNNIGDTTIKNSGAEGGGRPERGEVSSRYPSRTCLRSSLPARSMRPGRASLSGAR
jgi:NitT/TauT family transport system substrate-binding protein